MALSLAAWLVPTEADARSRHRYYHYRTPDRVSIPEPGAIALFGLGALLVAARARRA
jgi:hypothetical protein